MLVLATLACWPITCLLGRNWARNWALKEPVSQVTSLGRFQNLFLSYLFELTGLPDAERVLASKVFQTLERVCQLVFEK
jgi:hypothetical protein